MFKRVLVVMFIVVMGASLSGCALFRWIFGTPEDVAEEIVQMTDDDIRGRLLEFGGREIEDRNINVGGYIVSSSPFDAGDLSIFVPPRPGCRAYGWTQVIREWIDGQIVHDPTVLPEPDNDPGVRQRGKTHMTPGGFVVDGNSDGSGLFYDVQDDNTFVDKPHLPTDDLDANTLKPGARLYVMEGETCVKCLNPAGPYFACFKWYYAHIKGGTEGGDRSYLVTQAAPNPAPSRDFTDAVSSW